MLIKYSKLLYYIEKNNSCSIFVSFWERGTRLPLLRLPLSSLLFLWIWMRLHVDDDLARKEFSCSYICDKTYLLPTYLPIPHLSGFFDVSNFVVIPACIKSFHVRLSSFLFFFCKNTCCRCLNNCNRMEMFLHLIGNLLSPDERIRLLNNSTRKREKVEQ